MFLKNLCLVAVLVFEGFAQDIGFDLDGIIASATTTDNSYNTGGTIDTNGWHVIVPKNLQVGFPAAWVPWKDFVAAFTAGSFPNFEVSVVGNVVPGIGPVAGQISVSQLFLQGSQGVISQVNNDGTMKIANGPIIRINDPNAVYSAGYTSAPFMTADDKNPSIAAWGGFPMCVPRSPTDALCPARNRPGNVQGTFTAPDPLSMAPFIPGDFIEYAGFTNGAGEIVCYAITALNVQINTGSTFGFIRMEDAIIGVYSANPDTESADTRFIGFTSEVAGSPVTVSAIEVDPCTGNETFRNVISGAIRAGDVRNKFVLRFPAQATERYTREYLFQTNTASTKTSNGIQAGHYIQPVTEWIQPELAVPGGLPIAYEFKSMLHLTQGLGPDAAGNIWGPLDPFPQSGIQVFDISTCSKVAPAPAPIATTTTAAAPTPVPTDTVRLVAATWTSSGGGTFSVTCTSTNINSALVGMTLDYQFINNGPAIFNQIMIASTTSQGTWTFAAKTKQVGTVTCRSKLKGTATGAVTTRRRRHHI